MIRIETISDFTNQNPVRLRHEKLKSKQRASLAVAKETLDDIADNDLLQDVMSMLLIPLFIDGFC